MYNHDICKAHFNFYLQLDAVLAPPFVLVPLVRDRVAWVFQNLEAVAAVQTSRGQGRESLTRTYAPVSTKGTTVPMYTCLPPFRSGFYSPTPPPDSCLSAPGSIPDPPSLHVCI